MARIIWNLNPFLFTENIKFPYYRELEENEKKEKEGKEFWGTALDATMPVVEEFK